MTSPVFDGNAKTLKVIDRFYYVNITTGEKIFLSTRTQGVKVNEYFNFFVRNRLEEITLRKYSIEQIMADFDACEDCERADCT